MSDDTQETRYHLALTLGERITISFLLSAFKGDRTHSVMRKVKRINRSIDYLSLPTQWRVNEILEQEQTTGQGQRELALLTITLSKGEIDWLYDTYTTFGDWPTLFGEWIDTVEEKMRLARLEAVKQ